MFENSFKNVICLYKIRINFSFFFVFFLPDPADCKSYNESTGNVKFAALQLKKKRKNIVNKHSPGEISLTREIFLVLHYKKLYISIGNALIYSYDLL